MASRFTGRDYSTLRAEIIEFLRQRLPNDWDYTNLADPVVIYAESLARLGDQLHFTIDELRRECDVATAKRSSSIYSYAMREGYKMMLPKGATGTIKVNSASRKVTVNNITENKVPRSIHLSIHPFDEIAVTSSGDSVFSMSDIDEDLVPVYTESKEGEVSTDENHIDLVKSQAAALEAARRTLRINAVLGTKEEYSFTYDDINNDSTVDLPDPIIDRDLVRLTVKTSIDATNSDESNIQTEEWTYVDDVISSGFVGKIYTLTPKFIGGAITLCIEFPTNYRELFNNKATFTFEYIKIVDKKLSDNSTVDLLNYVTLNNPSETDPIEEGDLKVEVVGGFKGYTEYEDASLTRANYKKFTQDYSALLTKDDYISYIDTVTSSPCKVFDHSDNYKENVLPPGTILLPRVIYILADLVYAEREQLFYKLQERSSRSDCLIITPYGKDPYSIVVKAECFLLGTSATEVATRIKADLMKYYGGSTGDKIPNTSMINYLVHKASDKVVTVENCLVRDTTYTKDGDNINTDFNTVSNLTNQEVDSLFSCLNTDTSNPNPSFNNAMFDKYMKGEEINTYTYNKYPKVAYNQFPDNFPAIKDAIGNTYTSYEDIVQWQVTYGHFDNAGVDSTNIFNDANIKQNGDCRYGETDYRYKLINNAYSDRHYMVPYLRQVIVLIKAIGN